MTSPDAPLLTVRELTIPLPGGADRGRAVDGLTLDLQPGEVHCIVGESGSGKSMLASAIMGLLPRGIAPSAGEILFKGTDLLKVSEPELRGLRGREISMIFQEPMSALNPCYRIGNQMREVFEAHKVPAGRPEDLLRAVQLNDPRRILRAYPHQLSGGQRQRVMIAMALALDPAILIADEPTTALDVTTQAEILSLINALRRQRGTGVLFITHDFGVVAEIADRVTVMRHGQLVEQGRPDELLQRPKAAYTRELIDAIPRLRKEQTQGPSAGSPVLVIEGARKTYHLGQGWLRKASTVPALRDVSLAVEPGRTLGVVGESGSGKSTLARCIVRLEALDGGEIRVDGLDVAAARGARLKRLRRSVQMVFQDPYASLDQRRTVASILSEGPVNSGMDRSEARRQARELLVQVGLSPSSLERYPGEFSGGQRQRLCIARAVSMKPKVLVADEPVSALDVSVQRQVLALFNELRRELGIAIVFITHDMRVAAEVCDDLAVMFQGKVVETGRTADVLRNPQEAYTRKLLNALPGTRLLPPAFGAILS